jgi:tRNA pseudouridine(38-40) synthase
MRILAQHLIGFRNFYYFTNESNDQHAFMRTLNRIEFEEKPHELIQNAKSLSITFNGVGFLRYQVRFIVGTLIHTHQSEELTK